MLTIITIKKLKYLKATEKKYKQLFCEKPGCPHLKYYRFKFCADHVEGYNHELDNDTERPAFQSKPKPGEGTEI